MLPRVSDYMLSSVSMHMFAACNLLLFHIDLCVLCAPHRPLGPLRVTQSHCVPFLPLAVVCGIHARTCACCPVRGVTAVNPSSCRSRLTTSGQYFGSFSLMKKTVRPTQTILVFEIFEFLWLVAKPFRGPEKPGFPSAL